MQSQLEAADDSETKPTVLWVFLQAAVVHTYNRHLLLLFSPKANNKQRKKSLKSRHTVKAKIDHLIAEKARFPIVVSEGFLGGTSAHYMLFSVVKDG